MAVTIRAAKHDDLEATDALVCASINELTERHGFGSFARPSPPRLQRFSLEDDPDGLWVAEVDGNLAGFGFSWEHDGLWFLAQLFVKPSLQAGGIGAQLIGKTLAHAESRGAKARALITFAFNRASQGLYMRHGLYPISPLYMMSIGQSALTEKTLASRLRYEPLQQSADVLDRMIAVDQVALGASRSKHHGYMLRDGGLKGFSLWSGADCVGYAYLGPDGHIGPVAVTDADLIEDALAAALLAASGTQADQVSAFLPGSSPNALALALRVGMRITLPMLLMGDRLPRPWDRYLPRNPGLM
jgi:ribosomal protein S18 acetylase RimI-like enzyme